MKKSKKCPKCGGSNIVVVDGNIGPYGTGSNISLGMTTLSSIQVDRYICCDCTYVEHYIRDEDIHKLKNSSKSHEI